MHLLLSMIVGVIIVGGSICIIAAYDVFNERHNDLGQVVLLMIIFLFVCTLVGIRILGQ